MVSKNIRNILNKHQLFAKDSAIVMFTRHSLTKSENRCCTDMKY